MTTKPVNPETVAADEAWRRAHGALDMACSALAAVPGAGDQYERLSALTSAFQKAGAKQLADAHRAASEA